MFKTKDMLEDFGLSVNAGISYAEIFVDDNEVCELPLNLYLFDQLKELINSGESQIFTNGHGELCLLSQSRFGFLIDSGKKNHLTRYEFLLLCRELADKIAYAENEMFNARKNRFKMFVTKTIKSEYF